MSQSPSPERPISRIAFTPAVKAAQEERGSRAVYAKMETRGQQGPWRDSITPELEEFLAERDTLYLGTVSGDGQPYVQHRGGPRGFIKVLDDHTLALADYVGNAQYISLGNLTENEKASIFLMDYRHQSRIKIWGTARFVEDDEELLRKATDTDYGARPERVLVFHVEAWSPNCTQYITQRFTSEEIAPAIQGLQSCIAQLRQQLQQAGIEPAVGEESVRESVDRILERPPGSGSCAPSELSR